MQMSLMDLFGSAQSGIQKKVKCDFKQSLRKDAFFDKSHLSIYCIIILTYLWMDVDGCVTFFY
jgi:hypothetical protein